MYDYVDQPLNHLDHGSHFLVQSMRHWVQAVHKQRCPACIIGPTFAQWGVMPALAPFQLMMATLNLHGLQDMSFAPCRCPKVGEDEAILISLIATSRNRPVEDMTQLLKLIVTEDQLAPLHNAVDELAKLLAEASLLPGRPTPAPRSSSNKPYGL